jgi:hypothetical protein
VRRALPAEQRQMVGPFIFFDHFGPVDVPAGKGADVRPHPHIGLATITYLLLGEVQHRDSVGSNWRGAASRILSERPSRRARRRTAGTGSRLGSPCRRRMRTLRRSSSITPRGRCR